MKAHTEMSLLWRLVKLSQLGEEKHSPRSLISESPLMFEQSEKDRRDDTLCETPPGLHKCNQHIFLTSENIRDEMNDVKIVFMDFD